MDYQYPVKDGSLFDGDGQVINRLLNRFFSSFRGLLCEGVEERKTTYIV